MSDEAQVMRLPKYARGLQLVRFGVLGMLLGLLLSIFVITKSLTASSESDAQDVIDFVKYAQWAYMAAMGAMLVGTLLAVPDFITSKMSLTRILIATLAFGVSLLALWLAYRAISNFIDALIDPDAGFGDLSDAAEGLEALPMLTVVKDLAYVIGLIALVRSIRQTAVANDHNDLRDAASTVSGLVAAMLGANILYQLLWGFGSGPATFAIIGLVLGLGVLGFWIYCHLRVAKFLKAASLLVHEPHNLPIARIVSGSSPVAAEAPKPVRTSGPIAIRQSGPLQRPSGEVPASTASAPIIPVAAELHHKPAPRANTAPGVPETDGPKFLK